MRPKHVDIFIWFLYCITVYMEIISPFVIEVKVFSSVFFFFFLIQSNIEEHMLTHEFSVKRKLCTVKGEISSLMVMKESFF